MIRLFLALSLSSASVCVCDGGPADAKPAALTTAQIASRERLEHLGVSVSGPRDNQFSIYIGPESKVATGDLVLLKPFGRLRYLCVQGRPLLEADLDALKQLDELRQLVLSDVPTLSSKLLASLGDLRGVKHLRLENCNVDDEVLARLSRLRELKELWLRGTLITDRGVGHLSTLKNLVVLDLSNTNVDGKTLRGLVDLKHLRSLYLSETNVDDESALQALPKLRQLAHLDISSTNIGLDTRRRIRDALPHCDVDIGVDQVQTNKDEN